MGVDYNPVPAVSLYQSSKLRCY